jgi:hypothetical protein
MGMLTNRYAYNMYTAHTNAPKMTGHATIKHKTRFYLVNDGSWGRVLGELIEHHNGLEENNEEAVEEHGGKEILVEDDPVHPQLSVNIKPKLNSMLS